MNTAPGFWIEELRILRNWSSKPADEVRRIPFRRGLNIVWADVPSDGEPELPGFGGHAAGKTSLCRLLRWVLGEKHYGSKFMRDRIVGAFPDGWVVAKIWVSDKPWIVGRAFGTGHHPRALQANDFAVIFSDQDCAPFDEFKAALEKTTIGPFPVSEFPLEQQPIRFAHLLEWLTRDQECRLSGLLDWRHVSSNHESPDMSALQSRFLIRATLNLVDEQVRSEIERRQSLEVELNRIPDDLSFEHRNLNNGLAALKAALAPAEIPQVGESLFVDTVRRLVEQDRTRQTKPLAEAIEALELQNLQRVLSQLNRDFGAKSFQERELRELLEKQQLSLKEAERDGTAAAYERFWENLKPTDQYCRIPITIARFRCPLRQEFEPDASSLGVKPDLAEIATAARGMIEDLEHDLVPIAAARAKLETEVGEAESKISLAQEKAKGINEKRSKIMEQHALLLFRANEAAEACKRIEKLEGRQKGLEKEIAKSQETQEALQEREKKQIAEFSELYESSLKAFLGSGITGKCRFTREEIGLHAEYRGELSSGAIDTLKTLAFDIAAMRSAIVGKTNHPRFIILDSPREADMHRTPYHYIFYHLKSLETSDSNSPFQVILTTTEPPPASLQGGPELVLRLDASKREERLFRTDF